MILPLAMMGPLELPRPSGIATSHATLPVFASSATRCALLSATIQLVVVERHAAHRRVDAEPLLPDQIAGLAVERLDDAAGVVEEDGAVVRERRRLVRAALGHRRDPGQLQLLDVVARDLRQRAEARRVLIAPQHRPVAGRRIAQHLVGDRREGLHFAGDREAGDRRRR